MNQNECENQQEEKRTATNFPDITYGSIFFLSLPQRSSFREKQVLFRQTNESLSSCFPFLSSSFSTKSHIFVTVIFSSILSISLLFSSLLSHLFSHSLNFIYFILHEWRIHQVLFLQMNWTFTVNDSHIPIVRVTLAH